MQNKEKLFNDEIDISTLLSVFFDNLNFLFSVFIASILVITVFFFSSEKFYQSSSLLEIKSNEGSSFLPDSLTTGINPFSGGDSLQAEKEIYKSSDTVDDALFNLKQLGLFDEDEIPNSFDIKKNLIISTTSKSLMAIDLTTNDIDLSRIFLNLLNEEFIKDRKDFIKQSSAAGKIFIQKEIPRIKSLLSEAEENLNSFKVSTNTSDVIFDTNTRNIKLDRLRSRVNEIAFKELELKEFYKENHPIYLTLSEQKKLVLSQIKEIEADLPNIPSTQRTLENFRREVTIYSNVLSELSSQELSLGMAEASSLSNVRIINDASNAIRTSPKNIVYLFSLVFTLFIYLILLLRHFLGDRISNVDALVDYVGREKVLGEYPLVNTKQKKNNLSIADELLNKTVYELANSFDENTFLVVSSRKDAGKSEISKNLFNKLKDRHKVCLMDLDYRKKGLTKEIIGETNFKDFDEFNIEKENFYDETGSLFIPSFKVASPPDFFSSEEFKKEFLKIKEEFDYVICDTPPWKLFIDAKILSKLFKNHIYIVCNNLSTFRDLDNFLKDVENDSSTQFFYNKFSLYLNFLWYQYEYPYYSSNYYYDYMSYSRVKNKFTLKNFLVELPTTVKDKIFKWVEFLKNRFRD